MECEKVRKQLVIEGRIVWPDDDKGVCYLLRRLSRLFRKEGWWWVMSVSILEMYQ